MGGLFWELTNMTYQTPHDVLERTYRRAIEQADALGLSLAELMSSIDPDTAAELRAYVRDEYGMEI